MKLTIPSSSSLFVFGIVFYVAFLGWIQREGQAANDSIPVQVNNDTDTTVCMILADDVYDTRQVSTLDAYSYIASGVAFDQACDCSTLCYDYPYFQRAGPRCKCLETTQPNTNQHFSMVPQRRLLPDDFFDGYNLTTCPPWAQCSLSRRCPSRQECVNNGTVACRCFPIPCANKLGNPCGPGRVCRNTPTGYNCTNLVTQSCPAGCGPNATCLPAVLQNGSTSFQCLCNPGFSRGNATHLGCSLL